MRTDERARNAVFAALGFQPQEIDLPLYLPARKLRADIKALFESEILQPFAAHMKIVGTPMLAP